MSVKDSLLSLLSMGQYAPQAEVVQTRAAAPFEVNIPGIFPNRYAQGNWTQPTVRQALGVPAILRCVTLISNTSGALSMNGIRDGVTVAAADRPRIIIRPNPLTKPRNFFRDSSFWKATYGEMWWWVASRDGDGLAQSLWPVPPYEVKVEDDPNDARYPIIKWRNKTMERGDMVLDTLMPDPDNPFRGIGPLQLCGAALSAAVEAESWAANFYSEGGYPSLVIRSANGFEDEQEAQLFEQKWVSKAQNVPHVVEGVDGVDPIPVDEQGAQMLNARTLTFGQAALMFGLPGRMVEYQQSGASLTYANIGDVFDEFVKTCLWPNYLEGTEQEMTDLLPRAWVAEFDTDRFTRPDPKTRAEIHAINITSGVYDAAYAQKAEGIVPGSIETAPIPASPPSATPPLFQFEPRTPAPLSRSAASAVPEPLRDAPKPNTVLARLASKGEIRCNGLHRSRNSSGVFQVKTCNRLLSKTGHFEGRCPRCDKEYAAAVVA